MQELNRFDRPVEEPTYSNAEIAGLRQNGLLGRSEAEILDIIQTGFVQGREDDADPAANRYVEEQWEPSCLAIVHEGAMMPVLDLEEIIQRPRTLAENRLICKQVASVIYDILLAFLVEEGGGER